MKQSQFIKFISLLLLLMSNNAVKAGPQGMSEEQMELMMQNAGAMQECFNNIDPNVYKQLEEKGKQMESEIKALCAAGKRDEAMSTGMKYGMEMQNDPQLQEIRKCSKMMEGMMGNMPQPYMPPSPEEAKDSHICDDM